MADRGVRPASAALLSLVAMANLQLVSTLAPWNALRGASASSERLIQQHRSVRQCHRQLCVGERRQPPAVCMVARSPTWFPSAPTAVEGPPSASPEQKTSAAIYMVFAGVLLLQLVPPASAIALSAAVIFDEASLPLYIMAPLVLEASHYAFCEVSTRVSRSSSPLQKVDATQSERLDQWRRCLRDRSISTPDFITGWFYRRPEGNDWQQNDGLALATDEPVEVCELRRGNIMEWLSWRSAA